MKVSTKLTGNELHIILDGELDHSVADRIREQIDECITNLRPTKVILEMNKLRFMDSTGIGLILGRYKKLEKLSVPMYVTGTNKQVDKVFFTSGIYEIICKLA